MKIKISAVIPCFNSAKTIERALLSVLNQTLPPYEIIVVDDGSTDNTLEILLRYKSKITLYQQENFGAAAARNMGAKIAGGNYLAFLDADDVWHPDKIRIQGSIMDQDSAIGISSTAFVSISEEKYPEKSNFEEIGVNAIAHRQIKFIDVFKAPFLATPTVVIKRSLFDLVGGFDETLETAEDIDLWLRLCFKEKYIFIENILCKVITQNNSLTSRASQSPLLAHLYVIDKFTKENPNFLTENLKIINRVKSITLTSFGSSLLRENKNTSARAALTEALKKYFHFRALYLYLKTYLITVPTRHLN